MSPLFRIPLGLIIMFVGFAIVLKTETVYEWFGEIPFAEEKMGMGGSRLFYKLIGVLVVLIGMAVATNVISDMLRSLACLLTSCNK